MELNKLVAQMNVDASDIESRLRAARIEPIDLERLKAVQAVIAGVAEQATERFIECLLDEEETRPLFTAQHLERIRRLKPEHLRGMAAADFSPKYIQQRLELSLLYGKLHLRLRWFLGPFREMIRFVAAHVMAATSGEGLSALDYLKALDKVAVFDTSLMAETLVWQREQMVHREHELPLGLSMPVLRLRRGLLLLPLIGNIDDERIEALRDGMLRCIREERARVVILDITGVRVVDTYVAHHVVESAEAARMLGAEVILSGMSTDIAYTLARLGVDLPGIALVGDLEEALEHAHHVLADYRSCSPDD